MVSKGRQPSITFMEVPLGRLLAVLLWIQQLMKDESLLSRRWIHPEDMQELSRGSWAACRPSISVRSVSWSLLQAPLGTSSFYQGICGCVWME